MKFDYEQLITFRYRKNKKPNSSAILMAAYVNPNRFDYYFFSK